MIKCFFVPEEHITSRRELAPGALYFAAQPYGCEHEPKCEKHLHAVCPNGHHWDIDSRSSNCTLPNDNVHRCWVRHGEPPMIHVDKDGRTCAAGAGSIIIGNYHGFLHHGQFTDNL